MDVVIRRLMPHDAAILDRIAVDVFDEPVDRTRLAAYLTEPGHFMFVATTGGEVVGQCAAVIHRHPDKVTELYIDEVGAETSSADFKRIWPIGKFPVLRDDAKALTIPESSIIIEQGAFLDGFDDPADRERGTSDLLNNLEAALRRESGDS